MVERKWKGELAKPIEIGILYRAEQPYGYITGNGPSDVHAARLAKIPRLLELFGIEDQNDYQALIVALASELVPGFQTREVKYKLGNEDWGAIIYDRVRGRPRKWTREMLFNLLTDVEKIKDELGISSDRSALNVISRRKPWRSFGLRSRSADQLIETLESRLHDARKMRIKEVKAENDAAKLLQSLHEEQ